MVVVQIISKIIIIIIIIIITCTVIKHRNSVDKVVGIVL